MSIQHRFVQGATPGRRSGRRIVFLGVALLLVAGLGCGEGGGQGGGADTAAQAPGDADGQAPRAPAPETAAAGADEYAICATCHQQNGEGLANAYPPLAGSEYVTGDPARLVAIILHGIQGPITVNGMQYNALMPAWASQLSNEQIAAIATYERRSWGNSASAITPQQVAAVRAATGGRTTPWTGAELESATLE